MSNALAPKTNRELLIEAHSRIEQSARMMAQMQSQLNHQCFLLQQHQADLLQILKDIEEVDLSEEGSGG